MKRFKIYHGFGVLCLLLSMIVFPASAQDRPGSIPNVEMMFWETVRDSNDIEMYRAYVTQYPNGHFVPLAHIKIKALSKVAPQNNPKQMKPVKKASTPNKLVQLRSTPEKLTHRNIRACIKKHNFSDPKHNPNGRFKNAFVDNRNNTITDQTTGLVWQMYSSYRKLDGDRAKFYVDKLNKQKFGGRSNWRLPTVEELLSLMEHKPQSPHWFHIDPIFQDPHHFMADKVWSADEKNPLPESLYGGWAANFWTGEIVPVYWGDGGQAAFLESDDNYVKAVCTQ